jgi:hypothetical protein
VTALVALARSPRAGAAAVVREGRLGTAVLLVAAATVLSLVHTVRFASEVSVQDVMFGPQRSPAVTALLETLGIEMTAVVLYLVESSWNALLVVSALAPVLIWLLGATAIHASARLSGNVRAFSPMLVLVGYATGLTRPLADAAALAFGSRGAGGGIAQVAGTAALIWLAILAFHGIRAHYGVPDGRAVSILVVAIVFFYLAPLTLILVALIAILVAAVVLEYVPAR